jgi:hypothetical protein
MIVEEIELITRKMVQQNPNKLFLFGDNLERVGMGGQAAAMRGEPNAVGIPTKKRPDNFKGAFFTDDEFISNACAISVSLLRVEDAEHIVIPKAGLGTGLADLENRAPLTFKFLQDCLEHLKKRGESNNGGTESNE